MPVVVMETRIDAPAKRVFDLSLSIDLHMASVESTGEKAVGGTTQGLIKLNEHVTFRAKHFGFWMELTSKIVVFERPGHFRDSQVAGPFRRFDHDHFFVEQGSGTEMSDRFDFDSPLGFLGRMADYLFLERHMRAMLVQRNEFIKQTAESDHWQEYLGHEERKLDE
ncbi:MAG: ligand-binding SRPBCC domain-containing protein [Planctomycetota bacterium]|jgi:ligand-binding SRPBCC domain-containing protein